MRDTSRPVWPSLAYCMITEAEYGGRSLIEKPSTDSKPFRLVDNVEQRLPGGKPAAVLDQHRFPFVAIGGAVDRHVRRNQHVRHAPQRVVRRQWLRVGDIKAGAAQMAGAQRLDEIGRHHTATASDID